MNTPEDKLFGDEESVAIMMHREAHFGGSFPIMLDYYRRCGKGVQPQFEIRQIEALAEEELRFEKNLAPLLLSEIEAEQIKAARDAYEVLSKLYTIKSPKNQFPLLIADLILSEDEVPEKELQAIALEKSAIVPYLIDLIKSEDFYNPLFPGYGKAYKLAADALGRIGDKRALIALFESIGKGDFFDDEISLRALKTIGEPAKAFLLRVLFGRPLNEDNEKAAIALLPFKDDQEVAKASFQLLKELNMKTDSYLATYLILIVEGLTDSNLRNDFEAFSKLPDIPKTLRNDFKVVFDQWQKK